MICLKLHIVIHNCWMFLFSLKIRSLPILQTQTTPLPLQPTCHCTMVAQSSSGRPSGCGGGLGAGHRLGMVSPLVPPPGSFVVHQFSFRCGSKLIVSLRVSGGLCAHLQEGCVGRKVDLWVGSPTGGTY